MLTWSLILKDEKGRVVNLETVQTPDGASRERLMAKVRRDFEIPAGCTAEAVRLTALPVPVGPGKGSESSQ